MLRAQSIWPTVAVELNSEPIINLDEVPGECLESDERVAKAALASIANFVESYPEFNNLRERLSNFRDEEIRIDILRLAIRVINDHPRIVIVKNEANAVDNRKIFITYQNTVNSNALNIMAINDKGIIFGNSDIFEEYHRVLQVPLVTIDILERFKSQLENTSVRTHAAVLVQDPDQVVVPLETQTNTNPKRQLRVNDMYEPLLSDQRTQVRRRCSFNCNRLSNITRACLTFFIAMATFASIVLLFSNKEE